MNEFALPDEAASILVALGAGLIVGVERERAMGDEKVHGPGGVRTFAIAALLGVFAALTHSPVLLGTVAVGVVVLAAASYFRTTGGDTGITTEMALLATFVVGVLAESHRLLAAAAGVLIVVLLVARGALHEFARRELTAQELRDAVLLAACAILVLPILPDHPVDPWNVLNPRLVWQLTVLIMCVDAAGYVAQRLVGARAGLPISGLLGGFVSSTLVVATLGKRAHAEPKALSSAVAGAALSQIATIVELAMIIGVTDAVLLGQLRWPLLATGAAAAVYGGAMLLATKHHVAPPTQRGRAFSLRTALLFAAAFTAVALLVAWLQTSFGTSWALASVVLGAFADAHSTSASVATLSAQQHLTREVAAIGIGLVLTTNTVSKLAFARAGGAAYFWRLAPGLFALVATYWIVWWLTARVAS